MAHHRPAGDAPLDDSDLKTPDYDLALTLARQVNGLTNGRIPIVLATVAAAHSKKGNAAKAVELQEQAVEAAAKQPRFPEEAKKLLEQKLEEYKKAAKKVAP